MTIELASVPMFCAGVQFKFSEVRKCWVLLAPERLFQPDEHSIEILKLVDGQRSLDAIIGDLAVSFDAPRDLIASDVHAMLEGLIEKGVVRL